MKKKLTLLIALSITLATVFGCMILTSGKPMEKNNISSIEETSSLETIDADPLVPSGKKEVDKNTSSIASKVEITTNTEVVKTETNSIVKSEPIETETKPVVSSAPISSDKYVDATYVWNRLKEAGLNDYVCAGIMGNIMAEVGGQTLDISRWPQYSHYDYGYYGICQWSSGRKNKLLNYYGGELKGQVDFLLYEIYTPYYKNQLNYDNFFNLQDEKAAALSFAKRYERCSSKYYYIRQVNATKALNYFTK